MTVHIIKLCVGVAEMAQLAHWQEIRLKEHKRIFHITRMVPRRRSQVLDGGSIYWVMKGKITCRQQIIDIEEFTDEEGIRRCRLIFDQQLVPVRPSPRRAFQGWRYLEPDAAPPDLSRTELDKDIPDEMRADLVELGLM